VIAVMFWNSLAFGLPAIGAEMIAEQINVAKVEEKSELQKTPTITRGLDRRLRRKRVPKTFIEKFSMHHAVQEGFERNVPLSTPRHGSLYTEQGAVVRFTDRVTKDFIYRLNYGFQHTNYYKFSNFNILDQNIKTETALKLVPSLYFETEYRHEIFRRQHAPISDYDGDRVKLSLKHYLIKNKMYHKPSYIYRHHGYHKFNARDASGVHGLDNRRDNLNAFDYEVGMHLLPHLFIHVNNQFGRHESNDLFKDFYDYSYYRVTPNFMWHAMDELLLIGGYRYQRSHFDGRDLHGLLDRESLQSFYGGVYYQINKNFFWSANCHYLKNGSNVPEFTYSDSWFSMGIHFRI
jgi:hypothetical protein